LKKFEYYILDCHINEHDKWVINYCGKELLYKDFLYPVLHKLGMEGWELVSISTTITGEVINRALVPINVDGDVGVSNTTSESFYFKREVDSEIKISNVEFKRKLLYLQDVQNSIYDEERAFDLFNESLVKVLTNNGFTKGENERKEAAYTYYKDVTENITIKKIFGGNEEEQELVHYKIEVFFYDDKSLKITKFKKSDNEEYWVMNRNTSFEPLQSEIESIDDFIKN